MSGIPESQTEARPTPKESAKDTVIAVIIAFTLAFVFRGFVVEAYIIPTGSMAPTLLGAHMRIVNDRTGLDWAVGPWYYADAQRQVPEDVQGRSGPLANPAGKYVEEVRVAGSVYYREMPVMVHDRVSGQELVRRDVPLRSGDRIMVLKYIYALHEATRYDVVVFKDPSAPTVNFIKRLIGLPGEQVALVDGDVFVRPVSTPDEPGLNAWEQPGWRIARKPRRVQESVWQRVHDSTMEPVDPETGGPRGRAFVSPWQGDGWSASERARGEMIFRGGGQGVLEWRSEAVWTDSASPAMGMQQRQINDRYAYNDFPPRPDGRSQTAVFPVSDVRVGAGVEGFSQGSLGVRLTARGHEWLAEIVSDAQGHTASLRSRPLPAPGVSPEPWRLLGEPARVRLPGGAFHLEFLHYDQTLELRVDGRRVAWAEYHWSPAERIYHSTGRALGEILATHAGSIANPLAYPELYREARLRWEVRSDAPVTLRRLTLDRDLHYQPTQFGHAAEFGSPGLATAPSTTVSLGPDQFYVLGDNSPQSKDSRLWDPPDPWVNDLMRRRGMAVRLGVVPRDLMLGRAFFVYFPSMSWGGRPMPMIDFGRLRTID